MIISFEELKAEVFRLGWDDIGLTTPEIPLEDVNAYHAWIKNGWHASLAYMENELRSRPNELFPGAQSAVILVTYYKQKKIPFEKGLGVVASYARGRDYHHVHRKRLKKLMAWLEEKSGQKGIAKGFSDSSPIMEKALAVKAGLGWLGKNTLLIHRRFGTFTLLSGLLTTLKFSDAAESKVPLQVHLPRCGSCQRCVLACPVQALDIPYQLNANRCLSYHLIESKKPIPEEIKAQNPGYIFGCDICQDVCPHNQLKKESGLIEFKPEMGVGESISFEDLQNLKNQPEKLFGTPLQRRGVQGLEETMNALKEKWNNKE